VRAGSELLQDLVDLLEPIGNVMPAVLQKAKQITTQLNTVLIRQEVMLTANEKVQTANEKVLAAKDEALAAKDEALAAKDEANEKVLMAKQEVLTAKAKERASSMLIELKTKELASFEAQFEPRIMIDIIYDAIKASGAFEDSKTTRRKASGTSCSTA
jgi:hypothetical protein